MEGDDMRALGFLGLMALGMTGLGMSGLGVATANARALPGPTETDGPNCHALSRASGQDTLYVGTVLGGQNQRHAWGDGTYRDYRTFQGCFVSEATCLDWVARRAAHHSQPPGYSRCTRVFVGLTPEGARKPRGPVVQTKY